MFRGVLGFVVAVIGIPLAQILLLIATSNVELPASPAAGYLLFVIMIMTAIFIPAIMMVSFLLWISFKTIDNFSMNVLISLALPLLPALFVGEIGKENGAVGFVVTYLYFAPGFLSIAVLIAQGTTGRGLAYDLGWKTTD